MPTDDANYLISQGVTDIDHYAFAERVGMILEDDAVNPHPKNLLDARQRAMQELQDERNTIQMPSLR